MDNISMNLVALESYVRSSADPKTELILEWSVDKVQLQHAVAAIGANRVFRGDVYWCDLGRNIGSEEDKRRPAVVLLGDSHDETKRLSPTIVIAPITRSTTVRSFTPPVTTRLNNDGTVKLQGKVLLNNTRIVSKARLHGKICSLKESEQKVIDKEFMKLFGVYWYVEAAQTNARAKEDDLKAVKAELAAAMQMIRAFGEAATAALEVKFAEGDLKAVTAELVAAAGIMKSFREAATTASQAGLDRKLASVAEKLSALLKGTP